MANKYANNKNFWTVAEYLALNMLLKELPLLKTELHVWKRTDSQNSDSGIHPVWKTTQHSIFWPSIWTLESNATPAS